MPICLSSLHAGSGRLSTSYRADNASHTTYTYQGNTVKVTDPAGNWKTNYTDAFGNLTRVDEPDPTLGTVSTLYTYNSDRTMATKTDTKGQQYTFSYDSYKRLTQLSLPGTGVLRSWYYDTNPFDSTYSTSANGRLTAVQYKLQNGDTVTDMFDYKDFGAVTAKRLRVQRLNGGVTATGDLNSTFGYDTEGHLTSTGTIPRADRLTRTRTGYDSLSRLTCAYGGASVAAITSCSTVPSGAVWGQGYSYDGFGNLGAKTVLYGSVPTMSVGIDATTNRIVGQSYDANGNMLTHPTAGSVTYDAENHIATAGGASYKYGYDSSGKRIWASTPSGEQYFFYGPSGRRLGSYTLTVNATTITFTPSGTRAYFAGRLISQDGTHPMIEDRTHSMRVDASGNKGGFYPYGEDKGTPFTNDQVKFGTYTRDGGTLLDYADQRFYAWNYGRFMTPDPYDGSAQSNDPQTWNRYGYVEDDPVNSEDPSGQIRGGDLCGFSPIDWGIDDPAAYSDSGMGCDDGGEGGAGGAGGYVFTPWWNPTFPPLPPSGPPYSGGGQTNTGSNNSNSSQSGGWQPRPRGGNSLLSPAAAGVGEIAVWVGEAGCAVLEPCGGVEGVIEVVGAIGFGIYAVLTHYKGEIRPHSQAGQKADINWATSKYRQQCGKQLTPAQQDELHRAITKQGYSKEEILELMKGMFGCNARNERQR